MHDMPVNIELISRADGYTHSALVSAQDLERVAPHRWYVVDTPCTQYAQARIRVRVGGGYRTVQLHRFILDPPKGLLVDHVDHNGLNCTRANLRLATPSQNQAHRRRLSSNRSGLIGVRWSKRQQKWVAQIRDATGRQKHLGYFEDLIVAATVRDRAAIQFHGEYAVLNFPDQQQHTATGTNG